MKAAEEVANGFTVAAGFDARSVAMLHFNKERCVDWVTNQVSDGRKNLICAHTERLPSDVSG